MDFVALKKLRDAKNRAIEGILDLDVDANNEFINKREMYDKWPNVSSVTNIDYASGAMYYSQNESYNAGLRPQPILNSGQKYSYYIKGSKNSKHLPQDLEEFVDVYEKHYVYHNSRADEIREIDFINGIDADSSGTIEEEERAKIIIKDMNGEEISSHNLDDSIYGLTGYRLPNIGVIFLNESEVLCLFKTGPSTTGSIIYVKINTKNDKVVFTDIQTVTGNVTLYTETDYVNKTVGFAHHSATDAASVWNSWNYIDYNWDTSSFDKIVGPHASASKTAQPNMGALIGSNLSSGGIGTYHKDRGFGIKTPRFSGGRSNVDRGFGLQQSILGSSVFVSGVMQSIYSTTAFENCVDASPSNTFKACSAGMSILQQTPQERMWRPLGFKPTRDVFTSTSSSTSTTAHAYPHSVKLFQHNGMTLKEKPHMNVRQSKSYVTSYGPWGFSFSMSSSGYYNYTNQFFDPCLSINNGEVSTMQRMWGNKVFKNYLSQISSSRPKNITSKFKRFTNCDVHLFSSQMPERVNDSARYYCTTELSSPRINGLGLLECDMFDTFVHYKDSYVGTSLDED